MRERVIEFLKAENKTSAQLAEEIGVQASGISHIISGRNRPSLDFVIKMLERYTYLSSDWLIFGKGSMYKETPGPDLFTSILENSVTSDDKIPGIPRESPDIGVQQPEVPPVHPSSTPVGKPGSRITRIVWFYDDNTFREYYPVND